MFLINQQCAYWKFEGETRGSKREDDNCVTKTEILFKKIASNQSKKTFHFRARDQWTLSEQWLLAGDNALKLVKNQNITIF